MKILIVDDLEENLYLMEVMLKAKGYDVVSAKNGLEALDSLEEDSVDLIVSDILMPKMDGYGLCRKVKTDEKLREIPFIFYTATYTSKKDEEFALSLGADRFIIKPEQPEVFLDAIKELITEAEEKKLEVKKQSAMDEDTFLRAYNERLVNKLENRISKLRETNQSLEKEIQERKRIEKSLKEFEERYRIVADFTYDWEEWRDPEGNIIYISPSCERISGYSRDEFIDNPNLIFDVIYGEDRSILEKHLKEFLGDGECSEGITFRILRRDGKLRWIEHRCQPVYDQEGLYLGRRISNRDITYRKKAEDKIDRLYRLYATLSQVNESIVRIKDKEELYMTICMVCVDFGKFKMAWIGLIDPETGEVVPETFYGQEEGYLEQISINVHDDLIDDKPTTRAIRTGEVVITRDIGKISRKWRDEAIKRGYKSFASVPLKLRDEVIGVLNIYASESDFFKEDEEDLVKEMGMDISMALNAIESEKELIETEKSLMESETKYRSLFDTAGDGIILMKGEYFIECNDKALEIYELTREEIIGSTPLDLSPELQPDGKRSQDKALKFINQTLQGNPQNFEWKHIRANGEAFFVEITLNRLEIGGEYLIQAMVRDITQRKETEELLRKSEYRHKIVGQLISDFAYSCVHNPDGIYEIEWITDSFYHITGFSENDLKKAHCWLFSVHPDDETIAHEQLNELKAGSKNIRIFRIQKTNGEIRWIRNHVQCIEDKDLGRLRIYGAAQDITVVKEREEAIQNSLREKEVLLQEIHHRVKNNMQIISSLLSLQSQHVDEDTTKILEGSQNRVKSMALVHEKLYRSQNLSSIDMEDYVISLVTDLFYSQLVNEEQINLVLDIDDIEFNIETAIPCGLIINELASNALKYAFPSGRKGELMVSLKQKADNYELIVRDDGIGLPDDLEIEKVDSLGLQLVNSLISQIDGIMEINKEKGTEFKIAFQELHYTSRF